MLKGIALFAVVVASASSAQVVSYKTNNPAPITGDSDKVVCERQEKLGTRLGGKKVCLTVAEWRERREASRDITEKIQMGTPARCESPGSPGC